MEVHINDYLDIVCPHYAPGEVAQHVAERYTLYMVEREDYEVCKPHSFDQLRWECSRPFAPHAPEKFSEKFQRFTPFTLGKEFRQGESYYYICKYSVHCSRLQGARQVGEQFETQTPQSAHIHVTSSEDFCHQQSNKII